jgi:CRISPR/Cas system-associated endonuclease Cas1
MDRTLYLNENKHVTVFRDGPSIWVREEGRAGRRVPARLIGRVVIIGNVRLETDVITLFTDNDVPVTLMNRAGESAAVVMPYIERLPRYYEKQKELLTEPERIQRVKDWMYSQRRRIELKVLRRLSKSVFESFAASGFSRKDYRAVVEKARAISDEQWQAVCNVVRMLLREMVVGYIVKIGLDPHIGILNRRHNFGLALDICYILDPEVHIQSIQFSRVARTNSYVTKERGGWAVTPEGMRDIVHRFENQRERVKADIGLVLDNLFELMRELGQ